MGIIYLDLQQENLYGWEHRKLEKDVSAYAQAARNGAEFPPVPVQRVEDGYELLTNVFKARTPGKPSESQRDGGHRRSLGHYLAKMPLKVEVVDEPALPRIDPANRRNIRDIVLVGTEAELWE